MAELTELRGIGDSVAEDLRELGIETQDDLRAAFERDDEEVVEAIPALWRDQVAEQLGVDGVADIHIEQATITIANLDDGLRELIEVTADIDRERIARDIDAEAEKRMAEREPVAPAERVDVEPPLEELVERQEIDFERELVDVPDEVFLVTTTGCPGCITMKDRLSEFIDDGVVEVINIQEDDRAADFVVDLNIRSAPALVVGAEGEYETFMF